MKKNHKMLYEKQAEIAKAVAHPLRIAILDFLRDGPQCVADIADTVGSECSNVSRHLSVLVAAGVLQAEKQGLNVNYSLKTPCILKFFACITEVIKHQAKENQQILKAI